ncbi:MAG: glycosyltransferase [Bauldia sp.]|nr:glycosyltransferase [Bauldia sp.]
MDLALWGFGLMTSHGLSHVVSVAAVGYRLRRQRPKIKAGVQTPSVTLLRPVCGLENFLEDALRTSFTLSYRRLELIFCIDDEDDKAIPLVRSLIAEYPQVNARLLVGRDRIGANPKINNLVKGYRASTSDFVILSDSNALLPIDFVETLLGCFGPKVGIVSTAASMTRPENFPAELECAFINTLQDRWMLLADMGGFGFAHGKTMMFRRAQLDEAGGLAALTTEAADELAATRAMRRMGLGVKLAPEPVRQAIGRRRFATVWRRQLRWARLRRAGVPIVYPMEIFIGAFVPFACALGVVLAGRMPAWGLLAYVATWYGLEYAFARAGRFPSTPRMPLAWFVRDMLLPVLFVGGITGNSFEWRGKPLTAATSTDHHPPAPQG